MDSDCAFEIGSSRDFINHNRKDWSLSHDVKLLKYLEKFSQSLTNRSADALETLDEFEKDLFSVSLNIRTVSQRFQSLANKQFVEHCVLEDDLSSYSKPLGNKSEVSNLSSNLLLNTALSSCLATFHSKYSNYKEGHSITRTNHTAGAVNSGHPLPPLIGSLDFNNYYDHLVGSKEYFKEPMKKSEVNLEDNYSDKESLQDTLSCCSSSNVLPENYVSSSSLIDDHMEQNDLEPANTMHSHEKENGSYDSLSGVPDNNKINVDSRRWVPVFNSNGHDNIIPSQSPSSLFDDDFDADDNIFNVTQTQPFCHTSFAEDDRFMQKSNFTKNVNVLDECDAETLSKKSLSKLSDNTTSVSQSVSDEIFVNSSKSVNEKNIVISSSQTLSDSLIKSADKLIISNNILKNSDRITVTNTVVSSQTLSSVISEFESTKNDHTDLLNSSSRLSNSEKKFTLFSDQEDSDDELFHSMDPKQAKENFKRVLEEKIAFGNTKGNPKLPGKFNKNNNSSANSPKIIDSSELPVENYKDDNTLPNYTGPVLQSLVKNRPKIKNKRRPPSRKHLKEIHSDEPSDIDNTKEEREENKIDFSSDYLSSSAFSVLSPSTEEEDLFIVPTSSMTQEVSCSNLFSASSLLSPGSSLDNQSESGDFLFKKDVIDQTKSLDSSGPVNEKNYADDTYKTTSVLPSLPKLSLNTPSHSNKELIKKCGSSSAFWNNMSLFNDSEEDDDDLFSSKPNKKMFQKKTCEVNSTDSPSSHKHSKESRNKLDKGSLKEVFFNDSDDDDLFKVKESSAISFPSSASSLTKSLKDKTSNESGSKLLKSYSDFKDPLSSFGSHDD